MCGWQTTIDPLGSGAGIRLWYDDYADVLRLTVGTSDWFWHDVHLVEAVAADVGDIVDAVLAGRAWDRGGHLEVVTEDGRRHVSDPWVDPWFTKRWWARKSAPVRPSRRLPPYDTDV
ncbi:MAG: hypothetical protein JWO60_882 [Frankiales bacterium]|nr:hypothetical protein [Frankiales bacterium]